MVEMTIKNNIVFPLAFFLANAYPTIALMNDCNITVIPVIMTELTRYFPNGISSTADLKFSKRKFVGKKANVVLIGCKEFIASAKRGKANMNPKTGRKK
ncbi:hypothetical protein KCTCHS21_09850 [Cohnella abietis]|uniref:Uncharacterized protein n=1 Tax=Cohnella abietis TaxID=2507935 RepID=A0A3T1D0H0_9BACL|nr:hypothetical protein KCTCHS21_09850 [Cohnella abietis]